MKNLLSGPPSGRSAGASISAPLPILLFLLALLLPVLAGGAHAAAPAIDIASVPLTASCRVNSPGASAARVRSAPLIATIGSPAAQVFQASFELADWSGHFERYAVQAGITGQPASNGLAWDAGAILSGAAGSDTAAQAARPAPSQRNIYTAIVQDDGRLVSVPLLWDSLSPVQQAALDLAPDGRPDGLGRQRLDFLRGDRALEGTLMRRRGSVLGDSVHATPVLVGRATGAGQGADYSAFYQRSRLRRSVVYLGANDGMLHGFDAADGSELFAYVPDALFSHLADLSNPAYVHRAYVDGPASAGEALLGTHWKTVLVSAMGGGAQGVFALDVSDPEALAAGRGVLWEFTDRDDALMGNVTALPQIARIRTGSAGSGGGLAAYRYFAVVASGLNNYADDGHRSATARDALFLLALDKAPDQPWQLNLNYYRLITPVADPALAHALSAPALVNDRDGVLRYAYAGDLQGNVWRFDFNGGAPWRDAVGPGAGAQPLFVARDAAGLRQPITQQPKVVYAASGGYLVLFGTGKLMEQADRAPARFAPQSYYGILDSLEQPAVLVGSRRELSERVLSGAADAAVFAISGAPMEPGSKGWYLDFARAADTGERSIDSGLLLDGLLVFNTVLPGADGCAAAVSRSYALDALTGLAAERATTAANEHIVGLIQSSYALTPFALPSMASTVARPDSAGQILFEKNYSIANLGAQSTPGAPNPASDASAAALTPVGRATSQIRAGRLSWREVANWRELHQAARP